VGYGVQPFAVPVAALEGAPDGDALEVLCREAGTWLPNEAFMPIRLEYLETVSAEQRRLGISERWTVMSVVFNGPPIAIPEPDDFPVIGHLAADQVGAALAQHRDLVTEASEPSPAVEEFMGWLDACHRTGRDFVCFYY
jgi:hypothetical protein